MGSLLVRRGEEGAGVGEVIWMAMDAGVSKGVQREMWMMKNA